MNRVWLIVALAALIAMPSSAQDKPAACAFPDTVALSLSRDDAIVLYVALTTDGPPQSWSDVKRVLAVRQKVSAMIVAQCKTPPAKK